MPANAGDIRGSIPGWENPLEEGMATHSSILAWKIPRREEPGGLQPMGSQRVRHDWATEHKHTHTHTRARMRVSKMPVRLAKKKVMPLRSSKGEGNIKGAIRTTVIVVGKQKRWHHHSDCSYTEKANWCQSQKQSQYKRHCGVPSVTEWVYTALKRWRSSSSNKIIPQKQGENLMWTMKANLGS